MFRGPNAASENAVLRCRPAQHTRALGCLLHRPLAGFDTLKMLIKSAAVDLALCFGWLRGLREQDKCLLPTVPATQPNILETHPLNEGEQNCIKLPSSLFCILLISEQNKKKKNTQHPTLLFSEGGNFPALRHQGQERVIITKTTAESQVGQDQSGCWGSHKENYTEGGCFPA